MFLSILLLSSSYPSLHIYCSRVIAGDLEFCLWSAEDSCWYRVSDCDLSHIHHFEIQMGRRYSFNCRFGFALLIIGSLVRWYTFWSFCCSLLFLFHMTISDYFLGFVGLELISWGKENSGDEFCLFMEMFILQFSMLICSLFNTVN